MCVVEDDRVAHDGSFFDVDAGREHGVLYTAVDDATNREEGAADLCPRADLHRRLGNGKRADLAFTVVEVERRQVFQQVHVALEVRFDRAYVAPVIVESITEHLLCRVGDECRQDVAAEVAFARGYISGVNERYHQRVLLKEVDAHRDQVRAGLLRLLFKGNDAVVVVEDYGAEAMCLVHWHGADRNRDVRAGGAVDVDQLIVGHLVDVVARQDQHKLGARLLNVVEVLVDGVGGALVPVGGLMTDVGLKQRDAAAPAIEVPRAADADVVVQRAGAVLGEDADVSDLRVGAVAQGEVDDAVAAAERDGRFRPLLG